MWPQTSCVLALAAIVPLASAVTSITQDQLNQLGFQGDGSALAYRYAPIWFFGQSQNQVPCIPTWAFGGSPTTKDVYDDAHKTPSAPQCQYPNVGCNCRNPGVAIGNPAPAFPIYHSIKQCSDTQVRIAYNTFYQKDGATVLFVETGHAYDWERAIVVLTKANNMWTPTQLFISQHSGYEKLDWGKIQNTLSHEDAVAGKAKDPNGLTNLDHPKIYVAWSKHAGFDTRNTGWNDPVSQSTGNAFRSQDWWHFPLQANYIRTHPDDAAGKATGSADWGDATSNPLLVYNDLCTE